MKILKLQSVKKMEQFKYLEQTIKMKNKLNKIIKKEKFLYSMKLKVTMVQSIQSNIIKIPLN
jgi:hypothetical protein